MDTKVSKGEIFERVFINEPSIDLHVIQEAGSCVKIHVLNLPKDLKDSKDPKDLKVLKGTKNQKSSNRLNLSQGL